MKSWSFSRYEVYTKCPYRAKLQFVDRVPLPPRPNADRGTMLHENAQAWVQGKQKDLDPALNTYRDELAALQPLFAQGKVQIEEPWGWSRDFGKFVGWEQAWVRMKLDFRVELNDSHSLVIDLKSGRKSGNEIKHTEQGELYAVGEYLKSDGAVKQVDVEFWYIDQNETMPTSYSEDRIMSAIPRWLERGNKVTSGHYPPKPNIYVCKFCPFRAEDIQADGTNKGGNGACEHAAKPVKVARKKSSGFFDFGIK